MLKIAVNQKLKSYLAKNSCGTKAKKAILLKNSCAAKAVKLYDICSLLFHMFLPKIAVEQ